MLFWRSCSTTAKLFKHLLTYLSQKREQSQLWLLFGFSVESSHYTALLKFQSFSLLVPYQDLLDANSSNMISCCTFYLCWDRLINLSTNLADYLYTHLSMSLSSRQQFQVHKVEVRRLFWRWVFPSIRLIATLNLWWLLKVICLSIFLCIRACLCLYPFAYHTLKQLNKQTNNQTNNQPTNQETYCVSSYILSVYESVYLVVYPAMYLYVTVFVHLLTTLPTVFAYLCMSICVYVRLLNVNWTKRRSMFRPLAWNIDVHIDPGSRNTIVSTVIRFIDGLSISKLSAGIYIRYHSFDDSMKFHQIPGPSKVSECRFWEGTGDTVWIFSSSTGEKKQQTSNVFFGNKSCTSWDDYMNANI